MSASETVALLDPVAVGVNVTLIAHEPLGAMGEPETQLSVSPKSPGFEPPMVTLVIVKLAVPVFLTLNTPGLLDAPMLIEPKESVEGRMPTVGDPLVCPVPLKATV